MKLITNLSMMVIGGVVLLGCAQPVTGTLPSSGIRPGTPAEFRIENAQLLQAESWPVQLSLEVSGTLSSACHEVETQVTQDDELGEIQVEISQQPIEGEECQIAAQAFRERIPLGSFTSGDFVVLLNGEPIGELQLGTTPAAPEETPERGPVYVDQAELEFEGEFPVQVSLRITGSLPTPCATLYWSSDPPDNQGRIYIEVYSLQDPELACIQMLQATEVALPIGSFSQGSYTVWLNGELVGEFSP